MKKANAKTITAKAGHFRHPVPRIAVSQTPPQEVWAIEEQFYVTKRAAIRDIITDAQIWYDYLCV